MIKVAIVGTIVLLSLLIFLLRLPGFRGLRWLATDLFVAGGINVILCMVLGVGSSMIKGLVAGFEIAALDGIADGILSQLSTGVIVRTVIMVVAAVALLVVYYLLKNFLRNKKANEMAMYEEEWVCDSVTTEFAPEMTEAVAPAENEN